MKERCIWDAGKVRALEWEENERREDKEFKGRTDLKGEKMEEREDG